MHPGGLAAREWSLWVLALSPVLWSAHFMACYITAAVWCAKLADATGSLGTVRIAITAYTVAALAGIAVVGGIGWRWHREASSRLPHDRDTPADRQGFLGFSTVLLSGLSAVAVLYAAAVLLFFETCE